MLNNNFMISYFKNEVKAKAFINECLLCGCWGYMNGKTDDGLFAVRHSNYICPSEYALS